MKIEFRVNGRDAVVDCEPELPLLSVLRDRLGLKGAKLGCGNGECGACTVLVDDRATCSCLLPVHRVRGRAVRTVEGLAGNGTLTPLQQAFVDHGATQCGFCTSGMLLSAQALLLRNPRPAESEIVAALAGNICRCTGYRQIIDAVRAASLAAPSPAPDAAPGFRDAGGLREIGRRRAQEGAEQRVRGKAVYTHDVHLPDMLFAAVLRSPHAHARIVSIDTARALRLPGVHAVILADAFEGRRYLHAGGKLADRRPLAQDKVRFFGEEVAAVAADTLELAREALRLIEVEYETLPAQFTTDEALRPEGVPVHDPADTLDRNVAIRFSRDYGDVQSAFASAAHVFDSEYEHGAVAPVCMETNGTVASYDTDSGVLDVWTATQAPYFVRKELAHLLDLPVGRVRIRPVEVGGGFGGKSKINEQEALCAMLSLRTGRSVKLTLDRREEFVSGKTDHAKRIRVRCAVDEAGNLLARSSSVRIDNGAYTALASTYVAAARQRNACLYRVGAAHFDCEVVYTNKVPGGQYRGMGAPHVIWAIESQIDEIAEKLRIDPLQLRLRNANRAGDVTPLGWRISSCGMTECLEEVARRIGWNEKGRQPAPNRGIGIAAMIHPSGGVIYAEGNFSQVRVSLEADGTIVLRTQTADTGTWQNTTLAQIAAEAIGVSSEQVGVEHMDTANAPDDLGSTASRVAFVVGNATMRAASQLRDSIRTALAEQLGCPLDDIALSASGARVEPSPGSIETLDWAKVAELCGSLSAQARFDTPGERPDPETGYGNYAATYVFGAQAAEVEVDPQTGRIRILKMVVAQDVGRALNPLALEGQIYGGVLQGIGMALQEELVFEEGRPVNASMLDYRVPRIGDAPPIEVVLVETIDPQGPYGAKAAAEPTINATIAAIANAVAAATGHRFRQLPLRPDRVLMALARERGSALSLKPWKRPYNAEVASVRRLYPAVVFPALRRVGTRMAKLPRTGVQPRMLVPADLDELFAELSNPTRRTRIIAGGTDLLVGIRQGIYDPQALVDVSQLSQMRGISASDGILRIGGATRLAEIENDERIRSRLPALADCIHGLATPLVRQSATLAGDLCQEKRCWFFRSRFPCYQLGGTTCPCFAVLGDNRHHSIKDARRCAAPCPADLAPMLSALDASVVAASARGTRRIGIDDLYRWSGATQLAPDEAILQVEIPLRENTTAAWEKFALRQGDFAEASVAASVRWDGDRIGELRLSIGSVSPFPARVRAAERLLGGTRGEPARLREAAESTVHGSLPLSDNEHKTHLLVALAERALQRAVG